MKPLLLFVSLCLIVLFYHCQHAEPQAPSFSIDATIEGVDTGKVTLMKLNLITNESENVDETIMKDGKFSFEGNVESAYFHTIMINDKAHRIHFFLENSPISITGHYDKLEHIKIIGSREDSLLRSYNFDDIFNPQIGMDIMLEYPDYAFAAFTAYYQFQINNIPMDSMELVMNNFSPTTKSSIYYQHLNTLYNTIKKVAIGATAPSFSIPNEHGDTISLDSFRGKYVLIDFWASWCVPCRAANPALVEANKVFKDRNLAIVGISVDRDKERWLNAIKSDGLTWTNLSLLQGWGAVSSKYGVKAIPQNFLLDSEGVIIAKNIEGKDLVERLDDFLPSLTKK